MSVLFSWKPRLSPLVALCIFLVCERHQGEASDWFPYINVLPSTYTCPAYFKDEIMAVLPASVQIKALKQREAVQEIHSANQDFIRWECGALGLSANISGCVHHPYRIIHYNVAGCIMAHSLFLCLSKMGLFFNLHDISLKKCSSENWMSTFYLMNNVIKMFNFFIY